MEFSLILDLFVIFVVLVSIGVAFLRGFIREVLTIFGIVGGLVAAYIGGPLLTPTMQGFLGVKEGEEVGRLFDIVPLDMVGVVLAYGFILVLFVILLSVFSHFISEWAKNLGLGALDRTLGIVFGVVRAFLVLGVLYLPVYYLVGEEQKEEMLGTSKTKVYLEAASGFIDGFTPKSTEEALEDGVDTVEKMSETRKKLEELDVLKSLPAQAIVDAVTSEPKEGYTPEFRDGIEQLIENNLSLEDAKPTDQYNQ